MQIRQATSADEEQIVALLKASLGESSSEKSIRYWRWKHIDNPFGQSPVLVAEEAGELIGIRAFMSWYWQAGEVTYRALRAVDTATHPAHQGKGIFKRLTLQLLADCQQAGYAFIFNTPNQQSRPGYLKMGWEVVGRLPVRLQLLRPWALLKNKWLGKSEQKAKMIDVNTWSINKALDEISLDSTVDFSQARNDLHTPVTMAYLRWRFAACPVQQYYAIWASGVLLIFYIKEQTIGQELRMVQLIRLTPNEDMRVLTKAFKLLKDSYPIDYISVAPVQDKILSQWLNKQFFLPPLALGPVLTYRPIQATKPDFNRLAQWQYQLGDMELF